MKLLSPTWSAGFYQIDSLGATMKYVDTFLEKLSRLFHLHSKKAEVPIKTKDDEPKVSGEIMTDDVTVRVKTPFGHVVMTFHTIDDRTFMFIIPEQTIKYEDFHFNSSIPLSNGLTLGIMCVNTIELRIRNTDENQMGNIIIFLRGVQDLESEDIRMAPCHLPSDSHDAYKEPVSKFVPVLVRGIEAWFKANVPGSQVVVTGLEPRKPDTGLYSEPVKGKGVWL